MAGKPLATFKQRVRQLPVVRAGAVCSKAIERLRPYLWLGWKAYFGLAQTSRIRLSLDEWLRHRLRAIQIKHWRLGMTAPFELC